MSLASTGRCCPRTWLLTDLPDIGKPNLAAQLSHINPFGQYRFDLERMHRA